MYPKVVTHSAPSIKPGPAKPRRSPSRPYMTVLMAIYDNGMQDYEYPHPHLYL